MQYFLGILIISSIIFLFTLYVFCRDDFVLFRKNIDMEKIFNLAFFVMFGGLFFARLFYVGLYFKPLYLNPLAFFLFPYFPGLSLPGGLLGASLILIFLLQNKKYPEGRILDFFVISFFSATVIGEILLFATTYLTTKKLSVLFLIQIAIIAVLFFLSSRASKQHSLKEGSVGFLCMMLLSLLFIPTFFVIKPMDMMHIIKESSIWIVDLLISSFFFFRQDSLSLLVNLFRGK
jgi:hypothetical protein